MTEARANPPDWPPWLWRGLIAWGFVLATYASARGISQLLRAALVIRDGFETVPRTVLVVYGIITLAIVAMGLLVMLRGRRDPRAVLLALVLFTVGNRYSFTDLPWSYFGDAAGFLFPLLFVIMPVSLALFWPLFCMHISGGADSPRQRQWVMRTALTLAAAAFAYTGWLGLALMGLVTPPISLTAAILIALFGSGFVILLWNYRQCDTRTRNRIKIVLLAFATFLVSWLLGDRAPALAIAGRIGWATALIAVSAVSGLAGAALIAYAVLRRQLFDFGFALNRTLVYGTVSFIMLAAFGLAEWAIKHSLPEEWQKGSEFYSAAIALVLFLSVHHLRDWVEHYIERLFFRDWHRNEEELRRFVSSASHFDQSSALCRAFAEELSRFGQGTDAALYLQGEGGYRLTAGKLAGGRKDYPADDRAFALMRGEREPVKLAQTHSALPGVLALPMLDQGTLAGFALLASKPDGTDYRPDEVKLLGWSARHIGLDLQAMHGRELRNEVAGLHARVATLTDERDRLGALLAGAARPLAKEA